MIDYDELAHRVMQRLREKKPIDDSNPMKDFVWAMRECAVLSAIHVIAEYDRMKAEEHQGNSE